MGKAKCFENSSRTKKLLNLNAVKYKKDLILEFR